MKFDIKKPCANCPFRTDIAPFLNRGPEIAKSLSDDHNWFACHQTTPAGTGKRIKRADQSHCAGAMMVLWREGNPNIAMRLALLTKMITREQLEAPAPVFNSLEEFAAVNGGNSAKRKKGEKHGRRKTVD